MSNNWFLCRTLTGKERLARLNLENQSFTAYLPLYVPQWTKEPTIRPFLPGYIFVTADLEDKTGRWRAILSTIGIKSVLCTAGSRPEVVPAWVVEEIQEREIDGVVQLPPPKMSPREWRRLNARFKEGDAVAIKGSALDAIFCEVEDKHRAAVFVRLLGKLHRKSVLLSRLTKGSGQGLVV